QPFDFSLAANEQSVTLCPLVSTQNNPHIVQISVEPMSGDPRPVSVVVQDVEADPPWLSLWISPSNPQTPPFTAQLALFLTYPDNAAPSQAISYTLVIVGDDLVGQMVTTSIV